MSPMSLVCMNEYPHAYAWSSFPLLYFMLVLLLRKIISSMIRNKSLNSPYQIPTAIAMITSAFRERCVVSSFPLPPSSVLLTHPTQTQQQQRLDKKTEQIEEEAISFTTTQTFSLCCCPEEKQNQIHAFFQKTVNNNSLKRL